MWHFQYAERSQRWKIFLRIPGKPGFTVLSQQVLVILIYYNKHYTLETKSQEHPLCSLLFYALCIRCMSKDNYYNTFHFKLKDQLCLLCKILKGYLLCVSLLLCVSSTNCFYINIWEWVKNWSNWFFPSIYWSLIFNRHGGKLYYSRRSYYT